MTDNKDLEKLFADAVADLSVVPDGTSMSSRLRSVDRVRRVRTFVVATVAIVVATAGVAAAWPSGQEPIQLRVGDDGSNADQFVDDGADGGEPLFEDRSGFEVEEAVPAEPTPTPEPKVLVDLSAIALSRPLPTAVPTLAPVEQATEPVHVVPVEKAEAEEPPKKPGNRNKKNGEKTGAGENSGEVEHEPSAEDGSNHPLTAVAAYGSCEEPIPYDIYTGTAAPGAQITISSPYSVTVIATADSGGHWSRQVTFEVAPVGEPFTVTVSSGGQTVGLDFVRTG